MNKLTAQEAFEIANKNTRYKPALVELLGKIKSTAENGEYSIITRDYEFGSGSCYCSEQNYPEICKFILTELRELGYICNVRCIEKQFVDIWLEISWDKL